MDRQEKETSLRKFNPGAGQTDQDIIDQFVVRTHELKSVLDVLSENIDTPSCQHLMIVAPRGRGKTMLLERVAAELRTSDALSDKLLPVRFMEESHEVSTIAEFWLECLLYLSNAVARMDRERAAELRQTRDELAAEMNEEVLEQRARAAVLRIADEMQRKLVLMVENLQDLSADTDDDFGWQLRKVLQTEPSIMLLASATSRFKALDNVDEPFFELFRMICLEPLTLDECARLWRVASGDDVTQREIRPLQILTGGSPRLLVIVADFARHRSIRQLMEELVTLIDNHTEYFRSHLDAFAKTERRVYLAVIDLWQASTTGEIAKRARMDVRNTSALLGRLVDRGAVLAEGAGRKKRYSATERLYSIYYKLRRERNEAVVVSNLIRFMTAFYSLPELTDLSRKLMEDSRESPEIMDGFRQLILESSEASHALIPAMSLADFRALIDNKEAHRSWLNEIWEYGLNAFQIGDYDTTIELADRIAKEVDLESGKASTPDVAVALVLKAISQEMLGQTKKALKTCSEVVRRFGNSDDPEVQSMAAMALTKKGGLHAELKQPRAALKTYIDVVQQFGNHDDPKIQSVVATALRKKGVLETELDKPEAAVNTYADVVRRFGDNKNGLVQLTVATTLANMGDLQRELNQRQAAVKTYSDVARRFSEHDAPEVQFVVALALTRKGSLQVELDQPKDAMNAYSGVVRTFGDSEDGQVRHVVMAALVNKGILQEKLNESEIAIATYTDVIQRYNAERDSDAARFVNLARMGTLRAYLQLRCFDQALDEFALIYDGSAVSCEPGLQEIQKSALALIGSKASAKEVLDILLQNPEKSEALKPLVIALRQECGEDVRAPTEVLEVAADIRADIKKLMED